jgi:hypothetical protein
MTIRRGLGSGRSGLSDSAALGQDSAVFQFLEVGHGGSLGSFSKSGQKRRLRAFDSTVIENGMPQMF